jgi:hypothetical protein
MATKKKRASEQRGPPTGVKRMGAPRGEFGTRVARRVECHRCGSPDHVPYAPKDSSKALCRACAVIVLEAYEIGVQAKVKTRPEKCNLCGVPFDLPLNVEDDGDLLCRNCLRGFTAWQGGLDTPYAERSSTKVEPRRSGTVLRRRGEPGDDDAPKR